MDNTATTFSTSYRGFTIIDDKLLGYSLIGRNGQWCCSRISIDSLKSLVDDIIKAEEEKEI